MFAVRPGAAGRAAPASGRARRSTGGRAAGAVEDPRPARLRLGVEFGEIAADALVIRGRSGIAVAAADRSHRPDRDSAQDIAEHRRVAIDGAAGAAKARLLAQFPRPTCDAHRIDRPGEAEVRFLLADEDRGAAIRPEEHTSEPQA